MLLGAISSFMGWAKPARVAFVLLVACLGSGLGCGKLVGDVDVRRLDTPADGGPEMEHVPLEPARTACRPGLVQCRGPMLQVCERDGSGWQPLQRCASAELCNDGPGEQARCLA